MSLLRAIEACLRATGLPPSRFGRDAVSDPRLVHDLRRGRQPGVRIERRVRAHIALLLPAPGPAPALADERFSPPGAMVLIRPAPALAMSSRAEVGAPRTTVSCPAAGAARPGEGAPCDR